MNEVIKYDNKRKKQLYVQHGIYYRHIKCNLCASAKVNKRIIKHNLALNFNKHIAS